MTDDPLYYHLLETSWQRRLTPDEQSRLQAWLAAHPEAQTDWEAETALAEALDRLPPAPVASNFTARVLQAVEREQDQPTPRGGRQWRLPRLGWLLPRAAVAALVLGGGWLSYQHVLEQRRLEMVNSLRAVSQASLPSDPEVLENFDAIRAMSQTPPDETLLSVLK